MVYAVRVACHIYLDIHLNIHLDVYLDIHLNVYLNVYRNVYRNVHLDIYLNIYLNVYLTLPYLRLASPLAASRPPLHYLAPQSVNAIKVHSLVFPSSSTVNLRS